MLAERKRLAAADLSGGQQQMLALGMAFVSRPPGPADRRALTRAGAADRRPAAADHPTPCRRRRRRRARRAERERRAHGRRAGLLHGAGTIRFSGPTADLLARPDMLRSVFLRRASAGRRRRASSGSRQGERQPGGVARRGGRRRPRATVRGASPPSTAPRSTSTSAEIVGVIGPNGAGKTTIFDLVSGFLPLDAGRHRARRARRHARVRSRTCRGRTRAQLPGRRCCSPT